jgi:hypothetical protein
MSGCPPLLQDSSARRRYSYRADNPAGEVNDIFFPLTGNIVDKNQRLKNPNVS